MADQQSLAPLGRVGKILSAVTYVFDIVYRILLEYAKVVLFLLVALITVQVFFRLVLKSGIRWSEEVALLLMVWMAFISMAIGVQKRLHIAIVMFFNFFPAPVQYVLTKINLALTCAFGVGLVVYGWKLVAITMTSTLPATQWPAGTLYLMMPVSGVFIIYFTLSDFFGLERYRHTNIETGEDE